MKDAGAGAGAGSCDMAHSLCADVKGTSRRFVRFLLPSSSAEQ